MVRLKMGLPGVLSVVEREVGEALELVALVGRRVLQARLALGGDHFEAVRVEHGLEVASVLLRFGLGEEPVVEAHLGVTACAALTQ